MGAWRVGEAAKVREDRQETAERGVYGRGLIGKGGRGRVWADNVKKARDGMCKKARTRG